MQERNATQRDVFFLFLMLDINFNHYATFLFACGPLFLEGFFDSASIFGINELMHFKSIRLPSPTGLDDWQQRFQSRFLYEQKIICFWFCFFLKSPPVVRQTKVMASFFPFVFLRFLEFGEHLRNKRMNRKNKKGRNQLVDDIFSFCLPPPPLKEMLLCLCVSACGVDVSRCGLFNNNKKKSRKNVKMKTERDKSKTTALKDGTRCFVDILEQMQHLEKKKTRATPQHSKPTASKAHTVKN